MQCVRVRTKMLNQTQSEKEKKPEAKSEKTPPVNGVVYASLKEAIQKSSTLPLLPTSFQNVEEYIQFYASFVLQEVQAQALKMLNR